MRCSHCQQGEMRLVRFEQRREVYACRECQIETLLLDCHYCERRSVRRITDSVSGVARWACHRCQVVLHKCPECLTHNLQGWVITNAMLGNGQAGFSCQQCGTQWQSADEISA